MPESVPNTTTAVGLWLATFFPFWRILIFARGARYAAEKWVASSSPSARRGEDPQPRTHLHRGRVPPPDLTADGGELAANDGMVADSALVADCIAHPHDGGRTSPVLVARAL